MAHLFKWKIKENPMCLTCNVLDDVKHTIYDCSIAKLTLLNLYAFVFDKVGINITLTYKEILLGISCHKSNITTKYAKVLDVILILIKRELILQRDNKRSLTYQDLTNLISYQYNIEKANAKTTFKKEIVFKRWGPLGISSIQ